MKVRSLLVLVLFALSASLLLSACSRPLASGGLDEEPTPTDESTDEPTQAPTDEPTDEPTQPPAAGGEGVVYIDSVEALILESFPVQVNAVVRGNLADGCTTLGSIDVAGPENNVFTITISANRDPNAMCTQALVPFEETVSLPVAGLPAGAYSIRVNGEAETTFELAVDNGPAAEGSVEDLPGLIAALEAAGFEVEEGEALEQDFFPVAGQMLTVNGEQLQVFEFENDADAEAAAAAITGAGSMITLPDGSVIQLDFMSAPHWFHSGRLVVLYVGNTADILDALSAALGPELFGE